MSVDVLVVDDDPINIALHTALVRKLGYRAIGFIDPNEALVWCGSNTPDLLITDYMMPGGMNGVELIRQFRNLGSRSEVPIIMITATSHSQIRVDANSVGVSYLFNKPLKVMEFMDCVSQILSVYPKADV